MFSRPVLLVLMLSQAAPALAAGGKDDKPFVIAVTQEVETLNPELMSASASTYVSAVRQPATGADQR